MSISEYQLLNKVLEEKNYSLLSNNMVDDEYFTQAKEEYKFIKEFYETYHSVPDKQSFSAKFPNFDYFAVSQPVISIIDELREQLLFRRATKIINGSIELFTQDANAGAEYLLSHINELQPQHTIQSVDIIHDTSRLKEYEDKLNNIDNYFIPSGFKELDEYIFGWKRKEEFALIIARTGVGKSAFAIKSAQYAWKDGYNVGYFSPEMASSTVGFRFDSAYKGFSNSSLLRGDLIKDYKEYFNELNTHENKFLVSTMQDFNNKVTVPKLKNWCIMNNIDILFIDGFDYLYDTRAERFHSREDRLGHIAQDLVTLSIDIEIPIVGVIQANRRSTEDKDKDIGTENITGSDKIGASCTRLISLKSSGPALQITIPKNRYGEGNNGVKILYQWDADRSTFFYIPQLEDINKNEVSKQELEETKEQFKTIF